MNQTTTLPPPTATSTRPSFRTGAIAFWCLVTGLSLYFVVKNGIVGNVIPYLTAAELFESRHGAHGAWLFVHIIAGTCALLIGPLQFSTSIRRR
jgi:hypothetical protein